jgi:uncharacterized protein YjbI with pentapeptide repeats
MEAERDLRDRNLRRSSYRGANLEGADFGASDVRGADFTGAILRQASFVDARVGLPPLTGCLILGGSVLLSIATGAAIGLFAEQIADRAGSSDWRDTFAAITLGSVVLAFLAVFVVKGAAVALRVYLIVFAVVLAMDLLVLFLIAHELRLRQSMPLIILFLLFAPAALAGVLGRILGGTFGAWAMALVAATGGLAAGRTRGGIAAIVVMLILVFVSKRALKLDERDEYLLELAKRIMLRRGTRFAGADISGANFRGTLVAQSDLWRKIIVAEAKWDDGAGPSTPRDPQPNGD